MKKTVLYRYLGTNGTIESPVHLEDIYYVRLLKLRADPGKVLTNGERREKFVTIAENDFENWSEVDWTESTN